MLALLDDTKLPAELTSTASAAPLAVHADAAKLLAELVVGLADAKASLASPIPKCRTTLYFCRPTPLAVENSADGLLVVGS